MSKNNKHNTSSPTSDEEKDVLWKAISNTPQSNTTVNYSPRNLVSNQFNLATLSPSDTLTAVASKSAPNKKMDDNVSDYDNSNDYRPYHRKSTLEKKRIRIERDAKRYSRLTLKHQNSPTNEQVTKQSDGHQSINQVRRR